MQPGKRITNGEIGEGSILRITDYVCSAVAGKQRVVVSGQASDRTTAITGLLCHLGFTAVPLVLHK